jgi:hypothetical protein
MHAKEYDSVVLLHSGLTNPEFMPNSFLLVALLGSSRNRVYVLGHLAEPSNDLRGSKLSAAWTEAHTKLVGPSRAGSVDPDRVEAT